MLSNQVREQGCLWRLVYSSLYICKIMNCAQGNSLHSVVRFLTPCLRSRDCNQLCHYPHGVCETHAIVYKLLYARS